MKKLSFILALAVLLLVLPAAQAEQTLLTAVVPTEHALTLSCGEGGTLRVNGSTTPADPSIAIDRHAQVIIEALPRSGYRVDTFSVSSDYGVSLQGNSLVVERMVQDLSVQVTFKQAFLLVLPDDLGEISAEAFAGTAVEQVVCPDGTITIGSRAFADCTQLTRIVLPASVSIIADDAFEGCTGRLIIEGVPGSRAETFAQSIGAIFEPLQE